MLTASRRAPGDGRPGKRPHPGASALLARGCWGAALLVAPGLLLRASAGRPTSPADRWVLRVLGLRHLVQAGLYVRHPTPVACAVGGAVDVLHVASCLAVAPFASRWRRPALADAVVESALTVSTIRGLRPERSSSGE
ncbi:hypothetical protein SAMN04489712_105434 [Thermomonospora echinospora]|uniref:Uncharacterized protein n=1 Tax=Thermomonospora echinospora TaxID=1992 RepID=A0A1H6AHF2_9ACTN|nr:hypothetical protein [Thermomonospora echinospora]SEG47680.1 hypothetical protein SAMN04489712_105434 [Thermomonospora echinospora]